MHIYSLSRFSAFSFSFFVSSFILSIVSSALEIISNVTEEEMKKVPIPRLAFIVASKRLEEEIKVLLTVNP